MRVFSLVLLIALFGNKSVAQTEFLMPGATWVYYLPPDGGAFYPETEELTTVGPDTLIAGIGAKKLITERRTIDHFNNGFQSSATLERYVAVQNDSILIYENDEWNLVFNMDVEIGDSLEVYLDQYNHSECVRNDTIVITHVGDTIIHGEQLTRFKFKLLVNDWFTPETSEHFTLEFVERIGFMELFPIENPFFCFSPVASYWPPQFYCYSDNEITVSPSSGCGQILSVEPREQAQIKVTGHQNHLQIQNAPKSTLSIYNILGKQLYQERITSENQTFDFNQLPNGILMVVVENPHSRFTKKIIKTGN